MNPFHLSQAGQDGQGDQLSTIIDIISTSLAKRHLYRKNETISFRRASPRWTKSPTTNSYHLGQPCWVRDIYILGVNTFHLDEPCPNGQGAQLPAHIILANVPCREIFIHSRWTHFMLASLVKMNKEPNCQLISSRRAGRQALLRWISSPTLNSYLHGKKGLYPWGEPISSRRALSIKMNK